MSVLFARPLAITSDSVRAPATMGAAYGDTLRAVGGTGSFHWTLVGGALPEGLALDSLSGAIRGIPAQRGTWEFTARAHSATLSADRAFRLEVGVPALTAEPVLEQLLGGGNALDADRLRFLDLLGNRNGRFDVGDVRAWLELSPELGTTGRTHLEVLIGAKTAALPHDDAELDSEPSYRPRVEQ